MAPKMDTSKYLCQIILYHQVSEVLKSKRLTALNLLVKRLIIQRTKQSQRK